LTYVLSTFAYLTFMPWQNGLRATFRRCTAVTPVLNWIERKVVLDLLLLQTRQRFAVAVTRTCD
jgi:hypothetical protein